MRDYDLEIYSTLLKRPGLCLGTNDWKEVENFIRAYELGSKWECDFMNLLTDQLRIRYGVAMPSEGLIKQIQLIATEENRNWEDLFVAETNELLIKESDGDGKFRFKKILEEKVLKYFDEIPDHIGVTYFINLNQINRQLDDWDGESLAPNQIKMFKGIKERILKETSGLIIEKTETSDELRNEILELKMSISNER